MKISRVSTIMPYDEDLLDKQSIWEGGVKSACSRGFIFHGSTPLVFRTDTDVLFSLSFWQLPGDKLSDAGLAVGWVGIRHTCVVGGMVINATSFAAALSRMCVGGLVDKKEKRAVFRGVVASPIFYFKCHVGVCASLAPEWKCFPLLKCDSWCRFLRATGDFLFRKGRAFL